MRFLESAQNGALNELLCGATAALLQLCLTLPDLNANDIDAAMKIIAGTARSMGITVQG